MKNSLVFVFCLLALASFAQAYSLALSASPPGSGGVYGSASNITPNTYRNISATAYYGYVFSNWTLTSGSCNITNRFSPSTSVLVRGNCNILGMFRYVNNGSSNNTTTYSLALSASPSNGGSVYGAASNLSYGVVRGISAIPSQFYTFSNWTVLSSGNCSVANAQNRNTTATIYGNCQIRGNFARIKDTEVIEKDKAANEIGEGSKSDTDSIQISSIIIPASVVGVRTYGSVVVENKGETTSSATTAAYSINGQYLNSFDVPSLAPDASMTGQVTFICMRAGTYSFTVSAGSSSKTISVSCTKGSTTNIAGALFDEVLSLYSQIMSLFGVYEAQPGIGK